MPHESTVGSLFSGVGLLDIGLALAGFEHRWFCERDPFRRGILAKRFPGARVFDDVRTLRGEAVADAEGGPSRRDTPDGTRRLATEPERSAGWVDLIAGGFPCKGASTAGKREGFEHAETVLWGEMRRIIGEVRPRHVLVENVANILGMAAAPGEPPGSLWGTVLGDLAALGFDVVWDCVPAAAVGAPHLRDRVFAIATQSASANGERHGGQWGQSDGRADAARGGDRALADADTAHGQGHGSAERVRAQVPGAHCVHDCEVGVDWGDYQPAIARWEAIHGPAPEPLIRRLDDGDAKLRRLRARVDRSRLSALGDGVHVYCGWLAGEHIMSLERERVAA